MPTTPDEFVAALFVVIVLTALLIVGAGRVVVWVMTAVEGRRASSVSRVQVRDYVASDKPEWLISNALPARGNAEEEYRPEAEAAREAPNALTASDINRLLEEAREQATARALGNLIGAGLLPEGNRSRSMQALFGPAGRRHTRVRPWVAEAEGAARAARPDEPEAEEAPRVVTVSPGRPDERKLVI